MDSVSMELRNFEEASYFCSNVRQMTDSSVAEECINKTAEKIALDTGLGLNFNQRIALLEKIRAGLCDEFPTVDNYVLNAARQIQEQDDVDALFSASGAASLGKCLFLSLQQDDSFFDLDTLLKSARLIYRYDQSYFSDVRAYMEKNGFASYLSKSITTG
jgi:hypothetical protein